MKKILLLGLLIGLPSPLFAGGCGGNDDPTACYKKMESCKSKQTGEYKIGLWKKEHTNSKKWGVYQCNKYNTGCVWRKKGVSYDEANNDYKYICKVG